MAIPTDGWILWAGTTGMEGPLDERLDAAAAAGYTRASLSPVDIDRAVSTGTTLADLRTAAQGYGIEWIIDPVVSWLPLHADADNMTAARARHWGGFDLDAILQMAEGVGAVSASALAMTVYPHPVEALAADFATLCDKAAEIGLALHLEFVPMTVAADISIACDVVRLADRPNGGILFDTWHFFRGNPDFEVLAQVPGDRIFTIQVNDAPAEPVGTLWADTYDRRLPGDGDLDLDRTMRALEAIGALSWMGPEIFSEELRALGAREAARISKERITAI